MMDFLTNMRSARVIDFADLKRTMAEDTEDFNIYVMNAATAAEYASEYGIDIPAKLHMDPHTTIHIFGRRIELLYIMPDGEVLVIDKTHPNW